jgi:hypothetical protein
MAKTSISVANLRRVATLSLGQILGDLIHLIPQITETIYNMRQNSFGD